MQDTGAPRPIPTHLFAHLVQLLLALALLAARTAQAPLQEALPDSRKQFVGADGDFPEMAAVGTAPDIGVGDGEV